MVMQWRHVVSLAFCGLLIGCGTPEAIEATVTQDAYAQIEGLGDAAGSEELFAAAFVPGAVPEDRQAYGQRGYQVTGEASIDGDTATVPVSVFGGVASSAEGDSSTSSGASSSGTSEQVWVLQRVNDEWKIKDAPLE